MFIVGWIAKLLVARGMTERKAGPLSWGLTIIGAALLAFGAWQMLKHSIISNFTARENAKVAEKRLERVQKADTVDHTLGEQDATDAQAAKEARDHAIQTDPKAGTRPVGPVSNAVVDELRKQRSHQQRK